MSQLHHPGGFTSTLYSREHASGKIQSIYHVAPKSILPPLPMGSINSEVIYSDPTMPGLYTKQVQASSTGRKVQVNDINFQSASFQGGFYPMDLEGTFKV